LRVLGLDHGESRIGVAVSDSLGMLAYPVPYIDIKDESDVFNEIISLIKEYQVSKIVVGLPISLDGLIGNQAKQVTYFTKCLSEYTDIPIVVIDERLSTKEAERKIKEGGRRSIARGEVDSAAAAIVLQSYLDSQDGSNSSY
tara:strand:+ start:71 stop:496 length:426 start_codon:yes stop_codon:yes gene_type:complete